MGVVHKLNNKIIDFIINEKKTNKNISCRALAALIEEKFCIKVAKSSVNNILKRANLSSRVGRRSQENIDVKKFEIPKIKKNQLLANVQKHKNLQNHEDLNVQKEQIEPISAIKKNRNVQKDKKKFIHGIEKKKERNEKKPTIFPVLKKIPSTDTQKEEFLNRKGIKQSEFFSNSPTSLSSPFKENENIIGSRKKKTVAKCEDPIHQCMNMEKASFDVVQGNERKTSQMDFLQKPQKGMGLFVLKVALMELSQEFFLEKLLKVGAPGELEGIPSSFFETFLFLNILGVRSSADAPSLFNHALWAVAGLDGGIEEMNVYLGRVDNLVFSTKSIRKMEEQIEQNFMEVGGFEICLENGNSFFLDAQMQIAVKSSFSPILSFHTAMALLSKTFISNNDPSVFKGPVGSDDFFEFLSNIHDSFENKKNKRIKKIKIFNGQGQILTDFSIIPSKQRDYIFSFPSSNETFKHLFHNNNLFDLTVEGELVALKKEIFLDERLNTKIYYRQVKTGFIDRKFNGNLKNLKGFFVWISEKKYPDFVILTNQREVLPEKTLDQYFRRYPLFYDNRNEEKESLGNCSFLSVENIKKAERVAFGETASFWDILSAFTQRLESYCKRRFFIDFESEGDVDQMIKEFYSLDGYIERKERIVFVYFCPNGKFFVEKNIKKVIKFLNNGHIFDEKGRIILFKIKK